MKRKIVCIINVKWKEKIYDTGCERKIFHKITFVVRNVLNFSRLSFITSIPGIKLFLNVLQYKRTYLFIYRTFAPKPAYRFDVVFSTTLIN